LDQTDTNLDASTLNVNLNASQENAGSSPRGSATPKLDKDIFSKDQHKRELDELRTSMGQPQLKDQIRE